jgi:hypothetical protein
MSDMLLPDSRLKVAKDVIQMPFPNFGPANWVQIFCANCGAPGGRVMEAYCTFAFYLCDSCAEKWTPMMGTYMVPDEVFFEKVKQAQLEEYGGFLSPAETVKALEDGSSSLSLLAKDRKG